MTSKRAAEILAEVKACYESGDPMEFEYSCSREEIDEALEFRRTPCGPWDDVLTDSEYADKWIRQAQARAETLEMFGPR